VHGADPIPEIFRSSFREAEFTNIVTHRGNLDETARRLTALGVRAVLAGCESGVDLADALANELGLPANRPELRSARRDKFAMVEAARAAGLRTPAQRRSRDVADLLEWIREQGAWPVVVKPCASTASDNVELCHSETELTAAHARILDRPNLLGVPNETVLVQEHLHGVEYAIDTVSRGGRHQLTSLWRYGRVAPNVPGVGYESMTLCPCDERATRLMAFVERTLDALGVVHGPAHTEVLDVGGELVLIEMGARLCGGINAELSEACSGVSQVEETVRALIEPDANELDASELDASPAYRLSKHGCLVFLVPTERGRLVALPRLDEIRALGSVREVRARPRSEVPPPRVIGWVTLVHEDPEVLEADLRRIREFEADGLYRHEPERVTTSES
jgi:biotin carboxylase